MSHGAHSCGVRCQSCYEERAAAGLGRGCCLELAPVCIHCLQSQIGANSFVQKDNQLFRVNLASLNNQLIASTGVSGKGFGGAPSQTPPGKSTAPQGADGAKPTLTRSAALTGERATPGALALKTIVWTEFPMGHLRCSSANQIGC